MELGDIEERTHKFLPHFINEDEQKIIAPIHDVNLPPSLENIASPYSQESSSERLKRMRNIQELYFEKEEVTNFDILCCFFVNCERIKFDEVVTNKR